MSALPAASKAIARMIKPFLLAISLCCCITSASADVRSETSCYVRVPPGASSKPIRMTLRTYVDQDLGKEIGAVVQYNGSKDIIPLVFVKYVATDTDSPGLGNHELSRLEIHDRKVAGEYVFVQAGAGLRQGKYVKYTSSTTGKTVTLLYTGPDDPECKINF